MKGELYLRVRMGFPHGDEARILKRHLEDEWGWAYAVRLWDWFAEEHPEGEVTGPDAAYLIADGAGWKRVREEDKFCAAMVAAGVLAPISEGFRVRGWAKWAGYHLTVRAKERAKKQNQRDADDDCEGTSPVCPGDVPGMSLGQSAMASPGSPGDPSALSMSVSKASKGGAGGRKRRGIGAPDASAARWPLTAAVLAALEERGVEAFWPASPQSTDPVESAISDAGFKQAVDRLAAVLPTADKKWLGWHVDTIRGAKPKASNGPQPVSQDYSLSLEDVQRQMEEAARAKRQ